MTEARVKSFCKEEGIDIGYSNGTESLPRSCKEWRKYLYLYKSLFYVIWRSEVVFSLKTTEELKKTMNCEQHVSATILLIQGS